MADLKLIPVSEFPDDEHAFCPCGGLMSFNADTGQLECDDCLTDAEVTP